MNLKESFRYQNFLSSMISAAGTSITDQRHCMQVTKKHLRSKSNPDVQDAEEVVDAGDFPANDTVLRFLVRLIEEREKLTAAIGKAKASIGFDLDAAVETNKARQQVVRYINTMLCCKESSRTELGVDYKFNVEGNQTPYHYTIEISSKEAFNREAAKKISRDIVSESDQVSAKIDSAMINTQVEYEPPFSVNDTFDDIMAVFPPD